MSSEGSEGAGQDVGHSQKQDVDPEAGQQATEDYKDTAKQVVKKKRKRPREGDYVKQVDDKKLKGKLKYTEKVYAQARKATAQINQWLNPEDTGYLEAEDAEDTWRYKRDEIVREVPLGAARKVFDLALTELGPYRLDLTRNGRHMVLGGSKGHLAMFDWQKSELLCEVQVRENTHDVKFLHNQMFFAAAQKKYVYIYDNRGLEIHRLKDHVEARALEFLPYHFLLASVGQAGQLVYQDTSTGLMVAKHFTKLGPCQVMRQNPHNAVLCLGHGNGTLSMWTPNVSKPVVRMLCHGGPITSLAVDITGHHLVTAGLDGQLKVWDVRTYQPMHSYFCRSPATSLDISQRGLLAVGQGRRVQVWKDALTTKQIRPYLSHVAAGGTLRDLHFCPYEDVLALGHDMGISTMLVPGAGEPNFDSFVANPFQSKKERREQEVAQLLDKLQPDSIVLNPDSVGKVLHTPREVQLERRRESMVARKGQVDKMRLRNDEKTRMKGKNKPSRRHKKKQTNIIDDKRESIMLQLEEEKQRQAEVKKNVPAGVSKSLLRFYS